MSSTIELTVFAHDRESADAIPRNKSVRIMRQPRLKDVRGSKVFVLTCLSELPRVTEIVRSTNRQHRLKALLIREDTDPKLLPQILDRADVRTLQKTLVHSGVDVPRRVVTAWRMGAENELIATASVVGDDLLAVTCALEVFEVPFDAVSALRQIPREERGSFEVSGEGSYIHWPRQDVHLDLDGIRYAIDPEWRKRKQQERIIHDRRFGEAVATVRKRHRLRQDDIRDLSDRQVRRIERGAYPGAAALNALAAAHGLSVNEYLNEVAAVLKDSRSAQAGGLRGRARR